MAFHNFPRSPRVFSKMPALSVPSTIRAAVCMSLSGAAGLVVEAVVPSLREVRVWPVRGDGRCMWYALVVAWVLREGGDRAQLLDLDGDGTLAREARRLRRAVGAELQDGSRVDRLKPCYAPFWAQGEEGTENADTEARYLARLRAGSIYAGALELTAAAKLLDCPLVVVNVVPDARDARGCRAQVSVHGGAGREEAPLMILRRDLHYDAIDWRPAQEAANEVD